MQLLLNNKLYTQLNTIHTSYVSVVYNSPELTTQIIFDISSAMMEHSNKSDVSNLNGASNYI